jgi:hypothetical protein
LRRRSTGAEWPKASLRAASGLMRSRRQPRLDALDFVITERAQILERQAAAGADGNLEVAAASAHRGKTLSRDELSSREVEDHPPGASHEHRRERSLEVRHRDEVELAKKLERDHVIVVGRDLGSKRVLALALVHHRPQEVRSRHMTTVEPLDRRRSVLWLYFSRE